ncbi:MAG: hypothetical protein GF381_03670 [Candidatus Pacebacteria bacterium]|nr:hypothetical protein [Candidatus Paceibacterota bacterium]
MSLVNSAQWLSQLPKSEVGAYAVELARLNQQSVPVPSSFCIPISALKLIARHNNLEGKINQILKLANPTDPKQAKLALVQIKKEVRHQSLPEEVRSALHQFYHQQLKGGFVRLTASPIKSHEADYKREENIEGEANLLESLLKLWARNLTPNGLVHGHYFPVAIVIQSQDQPEASGIAYSQDPQTGDSSKIVIDSVWGVFQPEEQLSQKDRYILSAVDQQLIDQENQVQRNYYYRQLDGLEIKSTPSNLRSKISLKKNQAIELGKLVRQIKLNRVHHLKVHWELVDGELLITKIKPFAFSLGDSQLHDLRTKAVVVGKSVTSGFITTECQSIKTPGELNGFTPGKIAIVDQLDPTLRGLIHQASGIICQQNIASPELMKQVKQFSLPTITQASHALDKIKSGQTITLDAGAGRVYLQQARQQNQRLNRETKPQFWLAVNHPEEVSPELDKITQGIGLLRSEHLFIEQGVHPLQLIRTQAQELKQQFAQEISSYYYRSLNSTGRAPVLIYRSLNLTSNQLAKLKSGASYEEPGPNPYLGVRGGLKILQQPEVFEFELKLINYLNRQLDQPVGLLLPFVRSPLELNRLLTLIDQVCATEITNPPVWLQLNTPENLLNLQAYGQLNISGLTINTNSIQSLLQAVDPQSPQMRQFYPTHYRLLGKLIKKAHHSLKASNRQLQWNLNLSELNHELISLADELEFEAITVRTNLAKPAKEALLEIQAL